MATTSDNKDIVGIVIIAIKCIKGNQPINFIAKKISIHIVWELNLVDGMRQYTHVQTHTQEIRALE